VSDNLGNTYSVVAAGLLSGLGSTRLYRADITNPGTLTAITIDQSPVFPTIAAVSAEFSGVGNTRFTGTATGGSAVTANAFPGGVNTASTTYTATDLWIGVFTQASSNTFARETTGASIPGSAEPIEEVLTTGGVGSSNRSCGMLYYTGASQVTSVALLGRFSGTATTFAVGAAVAQKVGGPTYNDSCSGSIICTGSCVDSYLKRIVNTDAPAGSIALAGSCVDSFTHGFSDAPSGRMAFSGACVDQRLKFYTDAPMGALALAGTATSIHTVHTVYNDAPAAGAIGIAGTRTEFRRCNDVPTGRLAFGGVAGERYANSVAVLGKLRMWGWPAETLPSGTPRPVGIPGDGVASANVVANPTVLRPDTFANYDVGDLLLLFVGGASESNVQIPPSSDWVQLAGVSTVGGNLLLYGKIADSLEVAPPVIVMGTSPGDAGSPVAARVASFRNLDLRDLSSVVEAAGLPQTVQSTSVVPTGQPITTISDNALVMSIGGRGRYPENYTSTRPPSGFGLVGNAFFTGSGDNALQIWAYMVKAQAGLVPTQNFMVTPMATSPVGSTGMMLAFKPVPVQVHSSTPSGSLPLSGSCANKHIFHDVCSGSLIAHADAPTARLPLAGTLAESNSRAVACSGVINITGSCAAQFRYHEEISGALRLSGDATDDYHVVVGDDHPLGTLDLSGVLSRASVFIDTTTGTLVLRGRASDAYLSDGEIDYSDGPDGGLRLTGWSIEPRPPGFESVTGRMVVSSIGRAVCAQNGRVLCNSPGRRVRA